MMDSPSLFAHIHMSRQLFYYADWRGSLAIVWGKIKKPGEIYSFIILFMTFGNSYTSIWAVIKDVRESTGIMFTLKPQRQSHFSEITLEMTCHFSSS